MAVNTTNALGPTFDIGSALRLIAVHAVVKADVFARIARHAETPHVGLSGGAARAFFSRELAHSGVEQPRARGSGLLDLIGSGRSEITVGVAFGRDSFGGL